MAAYDLPCLRVPKAMTVYGRNGRDPDMSQMNDRELAL
jgi:hypothetical protein